MPTQDGADMGTWSRIAAWGGRTKLAVFIVIAVVSTDAVAQQKADQEQVARLHRIMAPLLAEMDNPIPMNRVKVTFTQDKSINAGNSGGGNFMVTAGLMQRANDDQLRAVIAHEVAHADRNHAVNQAFLDADLAIGAPLLDKYVPGLGTGTLGKLLSAQYSQDDEHEADAHGVELLKRAGYAGKKLMAEMLIWAEKQDGASGSTDGAAGFFATHPSTGDRVRAIRNLPN